MITKADMHKFNKKLGDRIADETRDAYSFKCKYYSLREWKRITRFLLEEGYGSDAVTEILYSKYMRWGYDSTVGQGDGEKVTLEKFRPYFKKERKGIDEMLFVEFELVEYKPLRNRLRNRKEN